MDIKHRFGDKLRNIREKKGMTMKEVALKAGVSESLVSQVETNKVSPSIDTLLGLTEVLEIDLEYLFQDFKRTKKVNIVRKSERNSLVLKDIVYHQLSILSETDEQHAIEALLLEIGPGAAKGDTEYGHPGKELGFILQGEGELVYGKEKYLLASGDTVSFPSDIPHILKNTGSDTLKAIWVITPPRMIFMRK